MAKRRNLLQVGNTKTMKGEKAGFLTGILHLSPGKLSGRNLCPNATAGCLASCLNTAGRGRFDAIQSARLNKSHYFLQDRAAFMADLDRSIAALVRKAERENLTPCVRLNGTSDLPFENIRDADGRNVFERFPSVQFYDYTKSVARAISAAAGAMPANYHLTFSRAETAQSDADAIRVLDAGGSVAVVAESSDALHAWLPWKFANRPIVDGDTTDLRFTDPRGSIVRLTPKADAKKDASGFVIRITPTVAAA